MKTYLVGGAVRDKLLGLPVTERDWVVVGATPAEMLAQGFRQVGKEFPVFLHPKTNEEYALARMERKINLGYKGFEVDASPSVSLEEDLLRRDLTINAMAETLAGELIDPYHGKKDLEQRLLKHVSPAFAEDPVRILRVARFLARYAYLGFKVAPETLVLMQTMVKAGEVNALVAERVWKELERALSEKNPEAFFSTLNDCHALTILFPDLLTHQKSLAALIQISHSSCESDVRFAALFYMANEKIVSDLAKRYRIPNAYKELALLTVRETMTAIKAQTLSTEELLAFFNRLDIFRREDRFLKFLQVVSAIATILDSPFNSSWLQSAAQVAKDIDVKSLLEQGLQGNDLSIAIKTERLNRLNEWICNQ